MKTTFNTSIAVIGSAISSLVGGFDQALEILLIFIIIDYLTGLAAAFKTKTVRSSTGYEGLLKKATIFLVVIIAAQLDRILGNSIGMFRTAASMFFVANEGISVLENVGELGVKLPSFVRDALEKLKGENDKPGGNG